MSAPRLGIIAGAGALPVRIAQHCAASGRPYFVARIAGMSDPALNDHPGETFGLGAIGARFKAMKAAGCEEVVFAGVVKRPDFATLKLDARGLLILPRVLGAAKEGDDALMRVLVEECEKDGFRVIGAEVAFGALLAGAGSLGAHHPSSEHLQDIEKAARLASALGGFDVGQGCVVCDGLVLAVEAQEGTDAMLARIADLPEAIRGHRGARRGVLLKRPKPIQERRIDLPTIGVVTIEYAARAGLAGIAVEAGGALIVDKEATLAAADRLGLFVYGFAP
jgi:hypothetical protein